MSAELVRELRSRAAELTAEEQRELGEYLLARAKDAGADPPRVRWRDLCGAVEYPLFGEDAQTYISRTRAESDARRERSLRGGA